MVPSLRGKAEAFAIFQETLHTAALSLPCPDPHLLLSSLEGLLVPLTCYTDCTSGPLHLLLFMPAVLSQVRCACSHSLQVLTQCSLLRPFITIILKICFLQSTYSLQMYVLFTCLFPLAINTSPMISGVWLLASGVFVF